MLPIFDQFSGRPYLDSYLLFRMLSTGSYYIYFQNLKMSIWQLPFDVFCVFCQTCKHHCLSFVLFKFTRVLGGIFFPYERIGISYEKNSYIRKKLELYTAWDFLRHSSKPKN